MKQRGSGMLGKHHSEESRLKNSQAHKGKRHTEEHKQRMRIAQINIRATRLGFNQS